MVDDAHILIQGITEYNPSLGGLRLNAYGGRNSPLLSFPRKRESSRQKYHCIQLFFTGLPEIFWIIRSSPIMTKGGDIISLPRQE
jgi:hypothetical protein